MVDDETFLRRFEDTSLPFEQWTHRAHIKAAYLYLRRHPLPEATDRMRKGIKTFNSANDVPEGPGMGYNETVTQAFMRLIHVTMVAYDPVFPVETADQFCDTHPHLLQKTILRLFYSPRGRDPEREIDSFVEPDLAPLPRLPDEGGAGDATSA